MGGSNNNLTQTSGEDRNLLNTLGVAEVLGKPNQQQSDSQLHPALAACLGGAFLLHVGVLLSLPPVLRGRGAPYLPTFKKGLDAMFTQIRCDPAVSKKLREGKALRFVDLGSGDGRVVFRAAREKLFDKSIGYEINPVLHLWASARRVLQAPLYWSSTDFLLRDLWKVDLRNVDVVAVYGLQPIMKQLGSKMKHELKPGAIVVSNVFAIPGWRCSTASKNGVHLYSVPSCWDQCSDVVHKISGHTG